MHACVWVRGVLQRHRAPDLLTHFFGMGMGIKQTLRSGSIVRLTHPLSHYPPIHTYSPFMSAPLEWGKLKDGCIVCPQSGSAFDLETGECMYVCEW